MFDSLPRRSGKSQKADAAPASEFERYIAAETEDVEDVIAWWWKRRKDFPNLSRMALDYLSIPGEYNVALLFCAVLITPL